MRKEERGKKNVDKTGGWQKAEGRRRRRGGGGGGEEDKAPLLFPHEHSWVRQGAASQGDPTKTEKRRCFQPTETHEAPVSTHTHTHTHTQG